MGLCPNSGQLQMGGARKWQVGKLIGFEIGKVKSEKVEKVKKFKSLKVKGLDCPFEYGVKSFWNWSDGLKWVGIFWKAKSEEA